MTSMSQPLKQNELSQDPTIAKQYDSEVSAISPGKDIELTVHRQTPLETQITDYYAQLDNLQTCLLITKRGSHFISRCMNIAKREGPDLVFLANVNSQKISDIKGDDEVNVSVIDTKGSNNWVSISGQASYESDPVAVEKYYHPLTAGKYRSYRVPFASHRHSSSVVWRSGGWQARWYTQGSSIGLDTHQSEPCYILDPGTYQSGSSGRYCHQRCHWGCRYPRASERIERRSVGRC